MTLADAFSSTVLDPETMAEIDSLEEPGQPSLLSQMAEVFAVTARGYLTQMAAAVVAGDAASLVEATHALKGSAAALGASRVRTVASELDLCAQAKQLQAVPDLLAALTIAVDEALQALTERQAR